MSSTCSVCDHEGELWGRAARDWAQFNEPSCEPNSMQYTADPVAALREHRRVAKPGAPVAILTWGAAEDCETRVILPAIGGLLPPPSATAGSRRGPSL